MKKLQLIITILFLTIGLQAQQDRINFIKVDTTQVDSTGVIIEIMVDYEITPIPDADTVKGVVFNITQIQSNILSYREMGQILRREQRNRESDFEGAESQVVRNYLKTRYESTAEQLKNYAILLSNEIERRKAFIKATKDL